MKFSQIIKKLRLDADMTQERLSEYLSISPQAVSRWETGIAMPDISLLPPLANLFHVTTDYLLGMDEYERDTRRAEYEAVYKDYWKMEDKEACEAAEQIIKIMIPDENYLQYHEFLQHNCMKKALLLCRQGCYNKVIGVLKQARYHAEEMIKFSRQKTYQYTAPLFDRLAGENEKPDVQETSLDEFFDCLKNNRCFDPVRESREFQALSTL